MGDLPSMFLLVSIMFPIVNSDAVTLKHRSEPQQIVRQSLLSCLQHLDAS